MGYTWISSEYRLNFFRYLLGYHREERSLFFSFASLEERQNQKDRIRKTEKKKQRKKRKKKDFVGENSSMMVKKNLPDSCSESSSVDNNSHHSKHHPIPESYLTKDLSQTSVQGKSLNNNEKKGHFFFLL